MDTAWISPTSEALPWCDGAPVPLHQAPQVEGLEHQQGGGDDSHIYRQHQQEYSDGNRTVSHVLRPTDSLVKSVHTEQHTPSTNKPEPGDYGQNQESRFE